MGALDVCPFIPISGVTEEECVQVSKNFGARLGKEVESFSSHHLFLLESVAFEFVYVSSWLNYHFVCHSFLLSLHVRSIAKSHLQFLRLIKSPQLPSWSDYLFQLSVPVFMYGSASTREYRYKLFLHIKEIEPSLAIWGWIGYSNLHY